MRICCPASSRIDVQREFVAPGFACWCRKENEPYRAIIISDAASAVRAAAPPVAPQAPVQYEIMTHTKQ